MVYKQIGGTDDRELNNREGAISGVRLSDFSVAGQTIMGEKSEPGTRKRGTVQGRKHPEEKRFQKRKKGGREEGGKRRERANRMGDYYKQKRKVFLT